MHSNLIVHIEKFVSLTGDEKQLIESAFHLFQVKKKAHLLQEGEICSKQYFIVKGCVRSYIVNPKGSEQTLQFAIENWWITDYMSYQNQQPSPFYIQATENSEVMEISRNELEELLRKIPALEKYLRMVMQKSFAASQMRIKFLYTLSAEERYWHFSTSFPDFVQRIPQYMLASYLDFTPEFMSKIRAGKTSK